MKALPDIQSAQDTRGTALQRAGVCDIVLPMTFENGGVQQQVEMTISAAVDVAAENRGVHMSRFMELLEEWRKSKSITLHQEPLLREQLERLEANSAELKWEFSLFREKHAPETKTSGLAHDTIVLSSSIQNGEVNVSIDIDITASNCCPCSREISEKGAHNQRVYMTFSLVPTLEALATIHLQSLIEELELCASSPVFPILKRPDEKWVTEKQYTNTKFVEDVVRDCAAVLTKRDDLVSFSVRVEAQESIHQHNAWAEFTS